MPDLPLARVCAVVVTFNRKKMLMECLAALRLQSRPVQAIYIVDNCSSDGTPMELLNGEIIGELPPYNLYIPWGTDFQLTSPVSNEPIHVHYVRMDENTGGAGGFYEGIKGGTERKYDWLWLMDDDGMPDRVALSQLLKQSNVNSVYNCTVISCNDSSKLSFGLANGKKVVHNYEELCKLADKNLFFGGNFFNGTLIPTDIVNKIGYPCREYFIHGDENEYYLRILANEYEVFTNTKSIHRHPEQKDNHSLLKSYYRLRNEIQNIKKYFNFKVLRILLLFTVCMKKNYKLYGMKGGWPIILGLKDGVTNTFLNRNFN